MLKYAVK